MRLLFIGGVADGEVREVSNDVACGRFPMKVSVYASMHVVTKYHSDYTKLKNLDDVPITTDTYQCERIRGIHSECRVMVYTKLTIDQMLRMLIDNYHPNSTDIST